MNAPAGLQPPSMGQVLTAIQAALGASGFVPTSRAITAGAGLTGGGDLSADRSLALDAAYTIPIVRTIAAGTGLTGGGDLSANRTLTLNPALSVTSATVTSLGSGVVHSSSGGAFTSSTIVNADVSASAAIAGTKVDPTFGAQAVSVGASVASAGDIRLTTTGTIKAKGTSGDVHLIGNDGSDNILIGLGTQAASVQINPKTGGFASVSINSVESVRWNATQQLLTVPQIQWVAAAATPNLGQIQATSGAGQAMTLRAQQGFAGSVGGIARVGSGGGGTPGTDQSGAIQLDLGAPVSSVSALCSVTINATTSILDINQPAASVTKLRVPARMTLQASAYSIEDLAANPLISYNVTDNQIDFFKDVHFGTNANRLIQINQTSGNGVEAAFSMTYTGQAGRAVASGTNNDGGPVKIRPGVVGTGGTGGIGGKGTLETATGTQRFAWNDTGMALFANTPVAQPARAGQLTDNSGGTSGGSTIASVAAAPVDTNAASLTSTRNAVATLAARVNLLEDAMRLVGVTAVA